MTTQARGGPYEVSFDKPRWLPLPSVNDVQGVRAFPTAELGRKLGILSPSVMEKVREALRYSLDL